MKEAHGESVGHGDVRLDACILENRHGGEAGGDIRELGVALQFLFYAGAVCHARAGVLREFIEQADIVSHPPAVALEADGAVRLLRREMQRPCGQAEPAKRVQGAEIDGIGKLGLEVLHTNARAGAQLAGDLIGDGGVDIHREDLGLPGMVPAHPVMIIIGGEAKGRVYPKPEGKAVIQLYCVIGVRYHFAHAAIAAVAAKERNTGHALEHVSRAFVCEFCRRDDDMGGDTGLLAAEPGHTGRIEEDRGGIFGARGTTCVSVPQATDALFNQGKPRAHGGTCGKAEKKKGNKKYCGAPEAESAFHGTPPPADGDAQSAVFAIEYLPPKVKSRICSICNLRYACRIIVTMEIVRLNRTARLLAGHPWVFSNEISGGPKGFEPGSLVELRDRKDAFLGIGYINPHSLISVRVLTRQKEEIDAHFFRKRILDALAYRKGLLEEMTSYRVVFSEGDFLPGLIVDKYDDWLSVQILTMGMEVRTRIVLDILDEVLSPSVIVLRNDGSSRLLEGLRQEKSVVKGAPDRLPAIREGSLLFEVDPLGGQKTGYFLDQRENRAAFSRLASGKGKGLDLFCYAGAWGLALAYKGAEVTGVDESGHAVALAQRNAEMNSLSGRCVFKKADVFDFLKGEISAGNAYDFAVLDPPAFVKSRTRVREALRAYREINAGAMRLLKKGGLLATSSCSYHVDRGMFVEMLRSAARDSGKQVRVLEMRGQAKDHPVLLSMPETEYLKCAFLEVG